MKYVKCIKTAKWQSNPCYHEPIWKDRDILVGEIVPLRGDFDPDGENELFVCENKHDMGLYMGDCFEEIEIMEKPKDGIQTVNIVPTERPYTKGDRLLLAGMAMQGILANSGNGGSSMTPDLVSSYSIQYANALLEELEK